VFGERKGEDNIVGETGGEIKCLLKKQLYHILKTEFKFTKK
jgi:hypothetical protein